MAIRKIYSSAAFYLHRINKESFGAERTWNRRSREHPASDSLFSVDNGQKSVRSQAFLPGYLMDPEEHFPTKSRFHINNKSFPHGSGFFHGEATPPIDRKGGGVI